VRFVRTIPEPRFPVVIVASVLFAFRFENIFLASGCQAKFSRAEPDFTLVDYGQATKDVAGNRSLHKPPQCGNGNPDRCTRKQPTQKHRQKESGRPIPLMKIDRQELTDDPGRNIHDPMQE